MVQSHRSPSTTLSASTEAEHRSELQIMDGLKHVDWQVVKELAHIPGGPDGSLQDQLRFEYSTFRHLHRAAGAKLGPKAALDQALHAVKRADPHFVPRYDSWFFTTGSGMAAELKDDPLARMIEDQIRNGGASV